MRPEPGIPGIRPQGSVNLANNSVGTREHWNVEVTIAGHYVDETSRPFATETEARDHARQMVRKYYAETVEMRRQELCRYLSEQASREGRGMHDRAGIKAAEAELAELEDDQTRALRERLRNQFNAAA